MRGIFARCTQTAALALTLLAAAAGHPNDAQAASLQGCGNANLPDELPIGYQGDDGFSYRSALYQFLSSTNLVDVAYPVGWLPQNAPSQPDAAHFSRAASVLYGLYDYDRDFNGTNHHLYYANTTTPVVNFWNACVSDWNSSSLSFSNQDKRALEQLWMQSTLVEADLGLDAMKLLHHDPSIYLRTNIEDTTACEAKVPITKLFNHLQWLTQWDYPGNSLSRQSIRDPLARRMAVSLALGLIMSDWQTFNANYEPDTQAPVNNEQFVHPALTNFGAYQTLAALMTSAVFADYVLNMARMYEFVRNVNPPWLTVSVAAAMQEGLARMGERLQRMRLASPEMNRFYQSAHATAAVKRALAGTTWQSFAADWHDNALDKILFSFNGIGFYPDDGNGYDVAYNQYNIAHTINLLLTDPGSFEVELKEHAHAIANLEAHMLFTDRTGKHYAPSAMSVRKGGGLSVGWQLAAGDHALPRLAASELTFANNDPVLPFAYARTRDMKDVSVYQPHSATVGKRIDPLSTNPSFHAEVMCRNHPNHAVWDLPPLPLANQTIDGWDWHTWQYGRPRFGIELHEVDSNGSSLLRRHADTLENNPSKRQLPFEKAGPYLHNVEDTFVFAKFGGEGVYFEGNPFNGVTNEYLQSSSGDYSVMFHIGAVTATSGPIPRGLGGGQIAALWAPGGGVFSLNQRKGYNNPPTIDSWLNDEWGALPIHAVTLIDTNSRWASSARIVAPTTTTHFAAMQTWGNTADDFLDHGHSALSGIPQTAPTGSNAAFLEVAGDFSDERYSTVTNGLEVLTTPVRYRRRFVVGEGGIEVQTDVLETTSTVAPTHRVIQEPKPKGQNEYPVPLPEVFQAWETIPLWLAEGDTGTGYVSTEITLITGMGQEIGVPSQASQAWTAYNNIETVIVQRENGTMYIHFDVAQTLSFSHEWDGRPSRNLLIDLTSQAISAGNFAAQSPQPVQLDPVSVRYSISFASL